MLALVEQPLRQGRSGSYSGEAKRVHGEAEAERLLALGLAALELAEGQLAETRKGAWEKEVSVAFPTARHQLTNPSVGRHWAQAAWQGQRQRERSEQCLFDLHDLWESLVVSDWHRVEDQLTGITR
ncbi:MAG: hypothetical protein NT154_44780 [Verrucomicrobia bacterium]|nr:hypothetical protein [Verrucomicrobiota bacterium]